MSKTAFTYMLGNHTYTVMQAARVCKGLSKSLSHRKKGEHLVLSLHDCLMLQVLTVEIAGQPQPRNYPTSRSQRGPVL